LLYTYEETSGNTIFTIVARVLPKVKMIWPLKHVSMMGIS